MSTLVEQVAGDAGQAVTPSPRSILPVGAASTVKVNSDPGQAVAGLFTVLSLPLDTLSDRDIMHEVALLAASGLLDRALLACATIWASRRCPTGPALALGPWAGSRLLQLAGGSLHSSGLWNYGVGDTGDRPVESDFAALVERRETGFPSLLLPSAPQSSLVYLVQTVFPDSQISWEAEGPRTYEISATREPGAGESVLESPDTEPLYAEARVEKSRITLTAHISRLWRSIAIARSIETDVADCSCETAGTEAAGAAVKALIQSPWIDLAPEIAPRLRESLARAESPEDTYRKWTSLLAGPPSAARGSAIKMRADMIWLLAGITVRSPLAGYGGLLAAADHGERNSIVAAARLAGVAIILPDSTVVAGSWHVDLVDNQFALVLLPGPGGRHLPAAGAETGFSGGHALPVDTARRDAAESDGRSGPDSRQMVDGDVSLAIQLEPGEGGTQVLVVRPRADADEAVESPDTRTGAATLMDVDHGEWRVRVDTRLLADHEASYLDVSLHLTGDRDADLARISQLHELLDRHPGPTTTRMALWRASFRKVTERGGPKGVTLNATLQAELVRLLGPDCVAISSSPTA